MTLAVAFLTMISVWSGIGMEVRAEGRTLEESSLKKGDMLYAGDTICELPEKNPLKYIRRVRSHSGLTLSDAFSRRIDEG